jgi:hypothetical protein
MLCSLDELGWSQGVPDRVALLADHLAAGTPLDGVEEPAAWLHPSDRP